MSSTVRPDAYKDATIEPPDTPTNVSNEKSMSCKAFMIPMCALSRVPPPEKIGTMDVVTLLKAGLISCIERLHIYI